jgi:MscS family membrane protein
MHLAIGNRKIFHPGLLLLLLALSVSAQSVPQSQDPLNRDTAQSSVYHFLEACHSHDYGRAAKYLDLRKLPEEERLTEGPQLAQELAQILDRDGNFDVAALSRQPDGDHEDGLPPNRQRVESFVVAHKTLELQLERVKLRSGLSVWMFSSDSVERIPQLAQMTSDSSIEKLLPRPLVRWRVVDTALWRWIALALLAMAAVALSKLLSRLVFFLAEAFFKRLLPRSDRSAFNVLLGPLRLMVAVGVFRAGMEWIGPSARLRLGLNRCLVFLLFLGLTWLGAQIVDLMIGRVRTLLVSEHHTFSYSVLPLVSRVLKLGILLLAIAAVLSDWGYNATTILAGLGVGGLAIALAAQKTIENFFGGVSVISDQPVSVGDFCKFGDRAGTVEDIGLRSTRLRTPERTLVTVPNGQFSSMTLENVSQRDKMAFHLTLNLRRDTTPDQVRTLLESITKILTDQSKLEAGTLPVRFVGVGTYSLDLEMSAYVLTRNDDEFVQIRQELLLAVLDAVKTAGTALALPTQVSVSYSVPGSPSPNGAPAPQTPVREH